MFAGRKYKRQEVVTQGDIIIPLSEIDWHNGFELSQFLWEEYTWSYVTKTFMCGSSGDLPGVKRKRCLCALTSLLCACLSHIVESIYFQKHTDSDSSFTRMTEENGYQSGLQGCSPGIGAAINCDLPLVNVIDTWSKIDGAGMHRSKDPGAGAITPYNDRKSRATRTIQAGEELYIDYGESYFSTRENTYGLMPLHLHYTEANEFLEKYIPLRDKVFEHVSSETLKDEMQKDLWDVITNFGFETRGMNALPQNYSEIDEIMEMGGTEWRNYKRSIRDLQWLDEHGQCMDNIKPGRSNIPNAGRGAFATRSIPKGGLVSPAPLIHIKDKKELIMYDLLPENEKGLVHRNASRPVGHQLLLNYCFGHPNSTLLFSPYGLLSSLINHSPDKANTRIQWTTSEMRSPEWMEMSPEEWIHESHSGLQFDFIALRDIAANEEITINYGKEWEAAWKDHVANWKKPKGADKYQAAYDMQKDIDADVPTEDEGGLGEHIQCYCHNHWRLVNGLPESDDDYHRCRPVKRFKGPQGDTRYMVELYYIADDDLQSSYAVTEVLFDVQRSVFHFEDTSYSRDHQQTFTFRHEIIMPDDMFPTAWMNKND